MKKSFRIIILAICALAVAINPSIAHAIPLSTYYTINNTGEWIDKLVQKNCPVGEDGDLVGNNNIERVLNFFTTGDRNLSIMQASGIVGNLRVEAPGPPEINPKQKQYGGGPGRGIAQWEIGGRWDTDMIGEKAANLKRYAEKKGGDQDLMSLDLQLEFMWYEMTEIPPFNETAAAMRDQRSVKNATLTFERIYERAGRPDIERRIQLARETYAKYKDGLPTSAAGASQTYVCAGEGGGGSIVDIAKAELSKGVKEIPPGCDAGNPSRNGSCGPEVDKYTDSTLEYWCADFVSWVYKTAGKPFTGGASGGWRIASVEGIQAWFERKAKFFSNGPNANPKPGDVYVINNGQHIGIVAEVNGNDLYVISGNTSVANYRNGSGVGDDRYQNFRSNANITGFGSLN